MVNWDEFREQLAEQLESVPDAKELETAGEYNDMVHALTITIQDTIDIVVPLLKPVPHSRRWWNRELTDLKRAKNRLNHLSYVHRAIADHPSHEEHREVTEKYSKGDQQG
jgi:hypothetical protein